MRLGLTLLAGRSLSCGRVTSTICQQLPEAVARQGIVKVSISVEDITPTGETVSSPSVEIIVLADQSSG
jgi:hypothetical protein